jgi:F420-0:gamma-glutamyl ligase
MMIVTPLRTELIIPNQKSIFEILDNTITGLKEKSVVVVTSKIIALCEGRVLPVEGTDKEELIVKESDFYLPSHLSKYGYHFTITQNTLISLAGIDESNSGGDYYVLWPKDSQGSANEIRAYLMKKFDLKELGVIVSDSTCMPMRHGTVGIPIGYSGFKPTNNYIGTPDLFGRNFQVSQAGVAIGLSAAAVLVMGEGTEQTPIAIIEEASFVQFQDHDPSPEELEGFYLKNMEDDLFEPFLKNAPWQRGDHRA